MNMCTAYFSKIYKKMEEFVSSIFYKSVRGFRDVFSCPQSSRFELSAGSCKGKFICLFDPLRTDFLQDGESIPQKLSF